MNNNSGESEIHSSTSTEHLSDPFFNEQRNCDEENVEDLFKESIHDAQDLAKTKFGDSQKYRTDGKSPAGSRKITFDKNTLKPSDDQQSRLSTVSIDSKQLNMSYNVESRLTDTVSVTTDVEQLFALDNSDIVSIFGDHEPVEEDEKLPLQNEEEPDMIGLYRAPHYIAYDQAMEVMAVRKIRNYLYQKRISILFKRRKNTDYLMDVNPPLHKLLQYNKQLVAYGEMLQEADAQRVAVTQGIERLQRQNDYSKHIVEEMFTRMQKREANIGYGLIHSKTGNKIPDKFVITLINRQKGLMEQLAHMRLTLIRLKEMIQEKLDAIEQLNIIQGTNLRLGDYEQMYAENRRYADKIEERDEELSHLRGTCRTIIQILAHMREKSTAFDYNMTDARDEYEDLELECFQYKEMKVELNKKKTKYRNMIRQIKNDTGLLVESELLRDMEQTKIELDKANDEILKSNRILERKNIKIRNLKKNIEIAKSLIKRKKYIGKK